MDAELLSLATTTLGVAKDGITNVVTDFWPVWVPIMLGFAIFFYVKRRASGAMRGSVKL